MTYTKHDYHCGPFWFPEWLKRILSKKFNDACAYHDEQYEKQNLPKDYIDDVWLGMMIDRSGTKWDLVVAYTFFSIMVIFGWTSWHRNKIRKRFNRCRS